MSHKIHIHGGVHDVSYNPEDLAINIIFNGGLALKLLLYVWGGEIAYNRNGKTVFTA